MFSKLAGLVLGGVASASFAVVDFSPTLRDSPCGNADKDTLVCLSAVNMQVSSRPNLYVVVYNLEEGKVVKATHTRVELEGGSRVLPTDPVVLEENNDKEEEVIQPQRTSMRRFVDYIGYKVYKVRNQESYQELPSLKLTVDYLGPKGPVATLSKHDKKGWKVIGKENFQMEHRAFPADAN